MADELRALLWERRGELRLSYQSLAAACIEAGVGASVSAAWLHRLETGEAVIAPSAETLAALAIGLRTDVVRLQEAAAAQFFGLRLPWDASGEAADLLGLVAALPEHQRRALIDLVRVMVKSC
jgi:transcriptional regulator with XRE-family HTH domain